jgi:prophage regulatory protein
MDATSIAWAHGYDKGFAAGFKAGQQLANKQTPKTQGESTRGRPVKIFDPAPTKQGSGRVLRVPDVLARIRLSKVTLYRMMASGKFPRPYTMSDRIVVWDEETVDQWVAKRRERLQ